MSADSLKATMSANRWRAMHRLCDIRVGMPRLIARGVCACALLLCCCVAVPLFAQSGRSGASSDKQDKSAQSAAAGAAAGASALSASASASSSSEDLYRAANAAYEQGKFKEAARQYSTILERHPGDPIIQYNLGNSYARLGDTGRAVWCYECALRAKPRFAEARANAQKIAPVANYPDISPLAWPFVKIRALLNVNEWLVLSFTALLAASLLGSLWILLRRRNWVVAGATVAAAVLFCVSVPFALSRLHEEFLRPAVVISPSVIARSGPGMKYLEAMEIPAGTKVYSAGAPQGGWLRIRTLDGRHAFIEVQHLGWIR